MSTKLETPLVLKFSNDFDITAGLVTELKINCVFPSFVYLNAHCASKVPMATNYIRFRTNKLGSYLRRK